MKLYMGMHLDVCLNNRDDLFSGVQHKGFDFTIFCGCG